MPAWGNIAVGPYSALILRGTQDYRSAAALPRQTLPIHRPGLQPVIQALCAEELVGCVEVLIRRGEREEDRVDASRRRNNSLTGSVPPMRTLSGSCP